MNQPPIAIVVTWGRDMIAEKGGLLSFVRYFEKCMDGSDEEMMWLQKCKNAPKHDIAHVYIIVCNQVRYKLPYGGHQSGEAVISTGNGLGSWSSRKTIAWPRLVLGGPFIKAPHKIPMKGFQGFRYVYNELF